MGLMTPLELFQAKLFFNFKGFLLLAVLHQADLCEEAWLIEWTEN